jgi:hypothetical protein
MNRTQEWHNVYAYDEGGRGQDLIVGFAGYGLSVGAGEWQCGLVHE